MSEELNTESLYRAMDELKKHSEKYIVKMEYRVIDGVDITTLPETSFSHTDTPPDFPGHKELANRSKAGLKGMLGTQQVDNSPDPTETT